MSVRALYICLAFVHAAAIARLARIPGAIPLKHVAFVFLSSAYAAVMNAAAPKFAARVTKGSLTRHPKFVRWLFPFTAALSIGLPWWLMLGDPLVRPARSLVAEQDGEVVPMQLAVILVPHLFLVHAQLLVETCSYVLTNRITAYVRISLPIAYVAYRLPVIFQWWRDALQYAPFETLGSDAMLLRLLAVCNGVFWAFGLFGFLLAYVLPCFFVDPNALNLSRERELAVRASETRSDDVPVARSVNVVGAIEIASTSSRQSESSLQQRRSTSSCS
jgi:hypothetical protein